MQTNDADLCPRAGIYLIALHQLIKLNRRSKSFSLTVKRTAPWKDASGSNFKKSLREKSSGSPHRLRLRIEMLGNVHGVPFLLFELEMLVCVLSLPSLSSAEKYCL